MMRWTFDRGKLGLAAALVAAVLAGAPAARAETEADVPRDPDFYYVYDENKYQYVPRPDLSQRPRPRDSRTLTGRDFGPDPQGTLRHFVVGGDSSSACIGEPVTALCAVETVLFALQNSDDSLLAAGMGPFYLGPRFANSSRPGRDSTVYYRVFDFKKIGPGDLKKGPRPEGVDPWYPRWFYPEEAWQPDDLQIQILEIICWSWNAGQCSSLRYPSTFTVREIAPGRWAVLSVYRARF